MSKVGNVVAIFPLPRKDRRKTDYALRGHLDASQIESLDGLLRRRLGGNALSALACQANHLLVLADNGKADAIEGKEFPLLSALRDVLSVTADYSGVIQSIEKGSGKFRVSLVLLGGHTAEQQMHASNRLTRVEGLSSPGLYTGSSTLAFDVSGNPKSRMKALLDGLLKVGIAATVMP
ncbi:MAG TPA: hypothetical protein VD907_06300 [Verrucomicrobiae bacterium]|nr:hypothetical protein [Verrucomicrobiae bacterium]